MKKTNHIFIFLFSALIIGGCSKERIEQQVQVSEYESMNNYFDSKKQDEQEIEIIGKRRIGSKFRVGPPFVEKPQAANVSQDQTAPSRNHDQAAQQGFDGAARGKAGTFPKCKQGVDE